MDNKNEGKKKKYIKLKRPKHPEMYSSEECAAFKPWKVVLKVENIPPNMDIPVVVDYEIYLRAPSVHDAQYTAFHCFMIWERIRPGLDEYDEYPMVCTKMPSEAYPLTEDQYKAAWIEAQSYPHTSTGMKENPSIFRFAKPGWQYPEGKIFVPGHTILVPDKSNIKK